MTFKFELEPAEVDFLARRARAGQMTYDEALATNSILSKMEAQANDKVRQGTAKLEKSPTVTKLPAPPQATITAIAKAAEEAVNDQSTAAAG